MDDRKARKEARKRGCELLWMLEVLDESAERGFIDDVSQKLEYLQRQTNLYVGDKARAVIEEIQQRDLQRKQGQGQHRKSQEDAVPAAEHEKGVGERPRKSYPRLRRHWYLQRRCQS